MPTTIEIPLTAENLDRFAGSEDNPQNQTIIICDPPPEMKNFQGHWVHKETTISLLTSDGQSRIQIERLAGQMRILFPGQDLDTSLFKKASDEQWSTLLGLAIAGYAKCVGVVE